METVFFSVVGNKLPNVTVNEFYYKSLSNELAMTRNGSKHVDPASQYKNVSGAKARDRISLRSGETLKVIR